MSETSVILVQSVVYCAAAAIVGYGLYRLIKRNRTGVLMKLGPLMARREASVDDWDRAALIYRIPGNTVGFLALAYLVLWLTIGMAGREEMSLESIFAVWCFVLGGLDSGLGIVGVVGIVCATVYGVHQDLPNHRMRALGAIGFFGILIGLGDRFH